jgi:hypothetical protein
MVTCPSNAENSTGIVCNAEVEVPSGVGLTNGEREVGKVSIDADGEKEVALMQGMLEGTRRWRR